MDVVALDGRQVELDLAGEVVLPGEQERAVRLGVAAGSRVREAEVAHRAALARIERATRFERVDRLACITELQVDEPEIEAVRGAIRTHMFDRNPVGSEALYLHDADALDWLGAIGAARILALVDPNGGKPDAAKAVTMLVDNLNKVPARVLSPAGRARVPERKAELEKFLADLRRETEDLHTL